MAAKIGGRGKAVVKHGGRTLPSLIVTNRSGETSFVDANVGLSVMEVIRDSGFDEMLALCGGCLSCATCHVYVDEDVMADLPPISGDENDLLDSSEHRRPNSRLSCQILVRDALNGTKITIAP
jgi:2Fe-2S ferredoxin